MLYFLTASDVSKLFERLEMYNLSLASIRDELPNVITRRYYSRFDMPEIKVTGISRNDKDPDLSKAISSIYSALAHYSIVYFRQRPNLFDIVHEAIDNIIIKNNLQPILRIQK